MQPEATRGPGLRDMFAVALVAALPLLLRAQIPPVYWWDEARIALNALEMMTTANPLVVTFNGEADLWNTKPPLAVWLSALSMRAFGVNELALRLPALLAAMATVLAVFLFTHRVSQSRATAWLAALALLGTGGYVEVHVARTADFDSLLVLFVTLATFSLLFAIERLDRARDASKYLYAAAAFTAAAMFTKSIAGLLMIPGYALYLAWSGRTRALATCRAAWVAGAGVAASILLFLVAREMAEPGFAQAAWATDASRFITSGEGHVRPWYQYLMTLPWPWQQLSLQPMSEIPYVRSAFPWLWLVPLALLPLATLTAPLASRSLASRASLYLLCCLLTFVAVISAAVSKLPWYLAPAYPLIAVLAALGVNQVRLHLGADRARLPRMAGMAALPAGIALGVACVAMNLWKTEKEIGTIQQSVEQRLPDFLRSEGFKLPPSAPLRIVREFAFRTPAVRDGRIVGTEIYDGPVEFYARLLRRQGRDAVVVGPGYDRQAGEVMIGCDAATGTNSRGLHVLAAKGSCIALGE